MTPAFLKYLLPVVSLFAVSVSPAPSDAAPVDETGKTEKPLNLAKAMPVKEVCLLLRGGYTSNEVLAEVNTRRLLEPVDAPAEAQLKAAGATPAFVNALRTGNYNLSAADAAAARERQAAISQKEQASRAAVAARQPGGAPGVAQAPASSSAMQAADPARGHPVADMMRNQLVVVRGGQLLPYNDAALAAKKLFLIYYANAAGSDPKFTSSLVDFYAKLEQAHPEVEMILYSKDASAAAMHQLMQTSRMPWPAVAYEKRPQLAKLGQLAVGDTPSLLLVDDSGAVVSNSIRDGKFTNPADVVKDLIAKLEPPEPK